MGVDTTRSEGCQVGCEGRGVGCFRGSKTCRSRSEKGVDMRCQNTSPSVIFWCVNCNSSMRIIISRVVLIKI